MSDPATDPAQLFAGSIPELYDRFMGPTIFEPWVAPVTERIAALTPRGILEIAAGTGFLAEHLSHVLPDAAIIATDLNAPMVDYAARTRHAPGVVWEVADAMSLPYRDGAFDVVACVFGAMFFPDRPAAYREMKRVLAPHGTVVLAIWDGIATHDIERITCETLTQLMKDESNPPFLERVPHGYGDPERITADLVDAGFGDITVEQLTLTSTAAAEDIAVGEVQGNPGRHETEAKVPGGLLAATEAVAAALLTHLGTGNGDEISGSMSAFVVQARR